MSDFACMQQAGARTMSCDPPAGAGRDGQVRLLGGGSPESLRLIATHTQRYDHPVMLHLPETEYLKGFTFEVVGTR